MNEAQMHEFDLRWKRDRLSRELSGADRDDEESDGEKPAPLSREELKALLSRRNKGAKP